MSEIEQPALITVFRDGALISADKPDWWDAEWDVQWPEALGSRPDDLRREEFGDPNHRVHALELSAGRGWWVDFESINHAFMVWCRTEADMLECLLTRGNRWLDLDRAQSAATSLEHIRNATITYLRHGAGERMVDAFDGSSLEDRRRETAERKRQIAEAQRAAETRAAGKAAVGEHHG